MRFAAMAGDPFSRANSGNVLPDYRGRLAGRSARDQMDWACAQCGPGTVLDVGCGRGVKSIQLGREGFNVLGIDIAPEAIDQASADLYDETVEVRTRVEFRRTDLFSLPGELRFQNILLGCVVAQQSSVERFIRAASQHVATGGRLVMVVPFGAHSPGRQRTTVFPRQLVQPLGEGYACDWLDIADGFIRLVARKLGPDEASSYHPDALYELTEVEAARVQSEYHDALFALHRHDIAASTRSVELEEMRRTGESLRIEVERLTTQLLAMRNESFRLEEEAQAAQNQAARAKVEIRRLKQELQTGKEQEVVARKRIVQLEQQAQKHARQHAMIASDLERLRGSTSFQLGRALADACKSPRDLVALPVRLWRLVLGRPARSMPLADPAARNPGDDLKEPRVR
jgi:2-polyprenyl-6-hydroxyphenyl methylase/3-demethylubiquinone-9 3-methyltransferase